MKKKDIKTLFSAIRKHENKTVKQLLRKFPELIHICATSPPKKDDGQSPLQVAFKTGNFEIADHLIDLGSDVNFIEESDINEWKAPVLHDAIRAAIFSVWDGRIGNNDDFIKATELLKKLLKHGANPNAVDSYGNSCLLRALLDARQRISSYVGFPEHIDNPNLTQGLQEIFKILIDSGADIYEENDKRESAVDFATEPALAQFLVKLMPNK